jgi:hypothetical protein
MTAATGLDATFTGTTGSERARDHQRELHARQQAPVMFRQDLDDTWTLRLGPLQAVDICCGARRVRCLIFVVTCQDQPRASDRSIVTSENLQVNKGQLLLAEVNIIRMVFGLDPVGRIAAEPGACGCPECSLRHSIPCLIDADDPAIFNGDWRLQFADADLAVQVGAALGQPIDYKHAAVMATDAICSISIAQMFGLIFCRWGVVAGWVEPTDEDQSVWDVHLLPGECYPPGHEPRGYDPLPILEEVR